MNNEPLVLSEAQVHLMRFAEMYSAEWKEIDKLQVTYATGNEDLDKACALYERTLQRMPSFGVEQKFFMGGWGVVPVPEARALWSCIHNGNQYADAISCEVGWPAQLPVRIRGFMVLMMQAHETVWRLTNEEYRTLRETHST